MTSALTKHGFPLVPTLDLDLLTLTPADASVVDKIKPKKKKKSLFAQMFEKKGPGFFGVECISSQEGSVGLAGSRDYVEPVSIGGEIGEQSHDMECQPTAKGDVEYLGGRSLKEGHGSTAAATWDRYVHACYVMYVYMHMITCFPGLSHCHVICHLVFMCLHAHALLF